MESSAASAPMDHRGALLNALDGVLMNWKLTLTGVYCKKNETIRIGNERASTFLSAETFAICSDLAAQNRHPILSPDFHFLSPFDFLNDGGSVAHDSDAKQLLRSISAEGLKTFYAVPFRDCDGYIFVAVAGSRERAFTKDEMKIIQSDCYDQIARLDEKLCGLRVVDVDPDSPAALSSREKECLVYAARGLTERETAVKLSISPHTVHAHLENAKRRLNAPNKLVTVVRSIACGLIVLSELVDDGPDVPMV